jgi:hypothetical protein
VQERDEILKGICEEVSDRLIARRRQRKPTRIIEFLPFLVKAIRRLIYLMSCLGESTRFLQDSRSPCNFRTSAQERVKKVVRERARTNRDRHVIFEQIGEDLDFTAGMIVASAFLAIWAQERPEEVAALVSNFSNLVPRN